MRKFLILAIVIVVVVFFFAKLNNIKSNDSYLVSKELREAERKEAKRIKDSIENEEFMRRHRAKESALFLTYIKIKCKATETESGIYYEIDKQGNRDKIDRKRLTSIMTARNYEFIDSFNPLYIFYDDENKESSKMTVIIKTSLLDSLNVNSISYWFPEAAQLIGEEGKGTFYIPLDPKTGKLLKTSGISASKQIPNWSVLSLEILNADAKRIKVHISPVYLDYRESFDF